MTDSIKSWGVFGGETSLISSALEFQKTSLTYIEVAELCEDPSFKMFYGKGLQGWAFGATLAAAQFEQFTPASFGVVEEDLVASNNYYDVAVCGPALRGIAKFNLWLMGVHMLPLVLIFGRIDALDVYLQKAILSWEELDFASKKDYASTAFEMSICMPYFIPLLLTLGRYSEAATILQVWSFQWNEEFDERFDPYIKAAIGAWKTFNFDNEKTCMRLTIFLVSSEGSIDLDEVNAWMPSPKEIATIHFGDPWFKNGYFMDIANLGARAYLKLGRDDDACELAQLMVSAEPKIEKKWVLMNAHGILGQIAAKRGNLDEADGHFASALEEAKLSRLPMLELLAAQDWKRHVLEPNGRECRSAEAAIDGACAKMNRTREELTSVLTTSGK